MEEKSTTRDYPQTSGGIVPTGPKVQPQPESLQEPNAFVRFLRFVFVKDIGIKLAAVLTAGALFLLSVGLSLPPTI